MTDTIRVVESSLITPKVRIIATDRPWEWLGAGWKDLWQAPAASIPYGLIFMIMGYVLVYLVEAQFHYALALTTGFLLAGPFLAMGLYDISRRLQMGEPATLGHALTAWRHNTMPILLFGIAIGLLMIVWARLSAVLFGLIITGQNMTLSSAVSQIFFSGSGLTFLLVFIGVGAVIAAVVFAISVVAIPMMLDRKVDFITAVLTSLTAVRANPGPMALWAALIVVFTGIGLISFYIGLVIALPLIGHATWHAYQELVDDSSIEQQPV
ncbi:MAG: DUF2189 domain-containing protein [Candidatus Competibacteraceae bacterium]|mgnify:FL=1|nr:DUF2189 domain-containing protein [Candidatus Competibacteraceae bacterium]MCP5124656.1 DUF2189 domain-containing protein [Gammaproteobacteria bacterium]HRX72344.1 DUF2189 domain-containing protein [Candidatus Competibacteraceae bacterium]